MAKEHVAMSSDGMRAAADRIKTLLDEFASLYNNVRVSGETIRDQGIIAHGGPNPGAATAERLTNAHNQAQREKERGDVVAGKLIEQANQTDEIRDRSVNSQMGL